MPSSMAGDVVQITSKVTRRRPAITNSDDAMPAARVDRLVTRTFSMTIEAIDNELARIESQVKPLLATMDALRRQRRELASKAFITANGITKADVELSSGDGKPWFGMVQEFVKWLKTQSSHKRFAEWNETIYFTTDLLAGRMPLDMPATIRELSV